MKTPLALMALLAAAPLSAVEPGAAPAGPFAARLECYRDLSRTSTGPSTKLGPDLVAVLSEKGLYVFSSQGGALTPRGPGEAHYVKVEGAELPYLTYQQEAIGQSRDAASGRAYEIANQAYSQDAGVARVLDDELVRRLGTLPARHEREERDLANETRGQQTRLPSRDDEAYRAALNACRAVGGAVAEAAQRADELLAAARDGAQQPAPAPKSQLNVPLDRYGAPR